MRPEALAELHALCFTTPRPWRADEFSGLLEARGTFLISHTNGFALGRIAGPEAELLTIAVHPDAQNAGHGRRLVDDFLCKATTLGAVDMFLEVAENNAAAIALYLKAGFVEVAKRKEYFKQISGPSLTALILKYSI
ncbi:MAG: GNAT family N-acetyltransferase [Rhodobacteraceae bacterium]|nr:GNAT family N-acetyltransferase [Paracoccaceae bacterium]